MKKTAIVALSIALAACGSDSNAIAKPQEPAATEAPKAADDNAASAEAAKAFPNDQDKISYAIGASIAQGFKNSRPDLEAMGFEFKNDMLVKGYKDALGSSLVISEDALKATFQEFRTELDAKRAEKAEAEKKERENAKAENENKGKEFLASNGKKDGVKTLESGLQYKVIQEGKGAKPSDSDTVKVHYKGTLIDGKQFDSSYDRGQPASFAVNRVIKGWTEALQLMAEGAKWELYIPHNLAYGDHGTPTIPPASTLVFEVELLEVVKKAEPAKAADAKKAKSS
jgi:FKBP-type peptidyl-prolyl cis-trans isomerase